MSDLQSNPTSATAIEVAEDDIMIISDDPTNSLTVDDLPMGVLKDINKQAAIQIIEIFKEKAPSMPPKVRDKIISLLKEGAFHHNKSSRTKPSCHPLAEKMWDKQVKGPWWFNITYEHWFILVGIYGLAKLEASAVGAGIKSSIQRRYGGDLGTDLTWRNHPVDQGQHSRHLLTQLAVRVSELQRTVDQQQKTIQKLVERQQNNQDASQVSDHDELMENWASYYEDEDEGGSFFPFE
ncbi:uncharacterized protein FFB20_05312 [Fusarium fujikuroi]|uniref:Uncharacterized protein n=1 Tax=Fusarium fujikuroi TaxID=5127 RepID=A0A5Q3G0U7_FUSFU|nr:Uncharacterized protein LW94_2318 [Fusarium fujikuroi]QGI83446.1 hypothetical protein CEK25_010175 [Fusarium fujikuroi]QGI97088.1 hypothetical protein CEK26_010157 [Fusarium fujikuroi]SCN76535.1 uncharacterized protein FFB20_05312 [Fusarium fujikuroi]SCN81760.1 uncharacterized protein FFE2_04757 [Fusarium fujikuroi]